MDRISYRTLRHYKYQLLNDYELKIDLCPEKDIDQFMFVALTKDGCLKIRHAYAWDGPSGPTFDTRDFMRGSLVHDALYQLMNLGALDYRIHRQRADEILRDICLEDGMWPIRAWYIYLGIRLFGGFFAKPNQQPEVVILYAP